MANETLSGRTALVTGASSGIGRAIALRLGEAGAHVFLAGRTRETMEKSKAEIEAAGGKATVASVDVRDPQQMRGLVDTAVRQTGRLDIMVNNAGLSYPGTIVDGEYEQWREMFDTNVLALLVGCQAAIRAMRSCKSNGHIVNISSIAGRSDASGVYGATKWAVNSIATTLRKELEEDSIRVVNIMPGAVITNFARHFPVQMLEGFARSAGVEGEVRPGEHLPDEALERLGQAMRPLLASPDDVARAVLFAVTQPIELNVFEIVVRPQKQIQL